VSAGVRNLDGMADARSGSVRQCLRHDRSRSPTAAGLAMLAGHRPCPPHLAAAVACGSSGSGLVSGCALHELSCPRGCRMAYPGGRAGDWRAEAAGHLSGGEAAADTRLAMCAGHQPSGGRSFRKQRTVNPPMVPARYNLLDLPQVVEAMPP
jgi:hypothetical protein